MSPTPPNQGPGRYTACPLPGHLLGLLPRGGHLDHVPQKGHPTFFDQQGAVLVRCRAVGGIRVGVLSAWAQTPPLLRGLSSQRGGRKVQAWARAAATGMSHVCPAPSPPGKQGLNIRERLFPIWYAVAFFPQSSACGKYHPNQWLLFSEKFFFPCKNRFLSHAVGYSNSTDPGTCIYLCF